MAYRPPPWWKSWTFLISIILAGIAVKLTVATPNAIGGGEFVMVLILLVAIIFKIVIEFILTSWQRRRDEKRDISGI